MPKKMVLFLVILAFAVNPALSDEQKAMTWAEAKSVYEKAIKTGYRTDVWGNWVDDAKSDKEKAEIVRHQILGANGSYSDLIIPSIGNYMGTWDKTIKEQDDDATRKEFFVEELCGLLEIFQTLDKQIKTFVDFREQAERDYEEYLKGELGRGPTKEDSKEGWETFIKETPKYAGDWPGFWSNQVYVQKGDRNYNQYHAMEIGILQRTLEMAQKMKSISVLDYDTIFKNMMESKKFMAQQLFFEQETEANRLIQASWYM